MFPNLQVAFVIFLVCSHLSVFSASLSDVNSFNGTSQGNEQEVILIGRDLKETLQIRAKPPSQIQLNKKPNRTVQRHTSNQIEVKKTSTINRNTKLFTLIKPIQTNKKNYTANGNVQPALPTDVVRKTIKPHNKVLQEKVGAAINNGNGGYDEYGGNGSKRKRRTHKRQKEEKGFMENILPMMVTPFLISSSMVPMMMVSLFFTMVKSAIMGKIGVILMLINMFTNRRNSGAVSMHNLDMRHPGNQVAMEHYGWHGNEEYGAYVNKNR